MAIDTPARHIYSGDGSTRVFPIPTYIQGDDYIRIEINGVHQVDRSKWDIVNNSIIFVTAPIITATIDVQVATSVEALAELGSVTNVDIVAANIVGISGIASNLDEVLLADDNAIIATTKASEALASSLIATTKASEALSSASTASSGATIATTKANESSTSATTATTKASEASASALVATTKASEASASATSASSSATIASSGATIATTKANQTTTSASIALASENKAKKWADESEDIPVESGRYSAKHWAAKAADIVSTGIIDDVSPSTSTVFSSTRSNNTYEPKNSNIQGHISNNTNNPHNVTKGQVGLSNVDNTSDANKPISDATANALAGKQDTLESGSNIKTINGTSVLGSGNIVTVDSTKLPLTGGTMTGAITAIRETKVEMVTNNIDLATGNLFTKIISGATTLTISNVLATGNVNSFVLELTNGGSAVITWFSGVKWAGGTAPTLTASGKDILGFYSHDGGTTWNILGVNKDVK